MNQRLLEARFGEVQVGLIVELVKLLLGGDKRLVNMFHICQVKILSTLQGTKLLQIVKNCQKCKKIKNVKIC